LSLQFYQDPAKIRTSRNSKIHTSCEDLDFPLTLSRIKNTLSAGLYFYFFTGYPFTLERDTIMTKSEFITELANRLDYLSYKDAAIVVNTFFDSISDALMNGDKVELRGFGSFKVKTRPPRTGRNPKTSEKVHVPAKKVPYFKPGKDLKNLMTK